MQSWSFTASSQELTCKPTRVSESSEECQICFLLRCPLNPAGLLHSETQRLASMRVLQASLRYWYHSPSNEWDSRVTRTRRHCWPHWSWCWKAARTGWNARPRQPRVLLRRSAACISCTHMVPMCRIVRSWPDLIGAPWSPYWRQSERLVNFLRFGLSAMLASLSSWYSHRLFELHKWQTRLAKSLKHVGYLCLEGVTWLSAVDLEVLVRVTARVSRWGLGAWIGVSKNGSSLMFH